MIGNERGIVTSISEKVRGRSRRRQMVGERDEEIVGHDAWRVGLNWNLKGDRDRT